MADHIGTERQLFLDGHLVEQMSGLKRVLHQPAKMAAPVLEGDKPWERGFAQIIGNCVNYDSEDRIYKMWYDTYKVTGGLIAYATSQDGLHWEKPDLGIVEVAGSRDNNIVLPGRNANVVKDDILNEPAKRYKAFFWHGGPFLGMPGGPSGHHAAFSPDGIHWKVYPNNPMVGKDHGTSDGQFLLGWDPRHGKYVAYMRPYVKYFEPSARTVAWTASEDFGHWGPLVLAVAADELDGPCDEYYRMTVMRYESVYVGFIWVYHNDRQEYLEQSRETLLAFSRNGITFSRPFGVQKLLETGPKGSWDSQSAGICNVISVGDELRFYYFGSNIPHDIAGVKNGTHSWPGSVVDGERRAVAVGVARLRRDGFTSVEPEAREGVLTTTLISFLGTRLHLNVDARRGRVEVEVQDMEGNPIAGYTRAECGPISSDSTDIVVKWRGDRDIIHAEPPLPMLKLPDGREVVNPMGYKHRLRKPVKLKFHIKDAKLYSFWVN